MNWLSHKYSLVSFRRNNAVSVGGVELKFDDWYRQHQNAPRYGVVEYGELEGSVVYFESMAYTRINQGDAWRLIDDMLVVDNSAIILSLDGDSIVTHNEYCIIDKIVEEDDIEGDVELHDRGVIKHHSDSSLIGHVVVFRPFRNHTIEDELHETIGNFFYMKEKDLAYDLTTSKNMNEWLLVTPDKKDIGLDVPGTHRGVPQTGVCTKTGKRIYFRKAKQKCVIEGVDYEIIGTKDVLFEIDNMKAVSEYILIKPNEENKEIDGILIPSSDSENRGTVLSVGDKVESIKEGDKVCYALGSQRKVEFEGNKYIVVREDSILFTY